MFRYLSILTFAITLSGCAGMFTPAAEPKDGERARLRGVGGAFFVDQNVCGDRPELSDGMFVAGPSSPYWQKSRNMPRSQSGLSEIWGEMYVRADQQIKVRSSYSAGMGSCRFESYFKPEKNRDYEFILTLSNFSTCHLNIFDITDGARRPLQTSKEKLPCN